MSIPPVTTAPEASFGDIKINGVPYRIDLPSWREKDIIDFAPRASVPGGSVVMSDLNLSQPLNQTDFRHGFGFHWYSDAAGYMSTEGNVDTRQDGLVMLFTEALGSDTDNNKKEGFVTFDGKLWSWGDAGLRYFNGTSWNPYTFSGVDPDSSASGAGEDVKSLRFRHTVTTLGQNRLLTVEVAVRGAVTVNSVTYNDVALTQLVTTGSGPKAEIWYLKNPPTGAHDVEIALSAASSVAAGSRSWLYVEQTGTFGASQSGSGTAAASSLSVANATGRVVIDCLSKQGPVGDALTVGANQAQDWLQSVSGTNTMQGAASQEVSTNASVSMSWSWTNSRAFAHVAVSIKPASAQTTGKVNYALNAGDYLFYAPDGQRLRKIKASNNVDSAAGLNSGASDYRWIIIHNGYVYAGKDGTNRIHFDNHEDASGLEGTTADTNIIYCGLGNIPTLWAIVFAGNLYVAREDGLWQIGEDRIARKVLDYANEISSINFRSGAVINGFLVFPVRDRIIQWNGARVADISPPKATDFFPYVTYGTFDNFVAVDNFLYLTAVDNKSPRDTVLLCWDGVGWTRLSDLVLDNSNITITAMAYDVINHRLWYHKDDPTADQTFYIQMQANSSFPFAGFPTTGSHSLITSRLDMGFRRVTKSMSAILVEARNVSPTCYIEVYYKVGDVRFWNFWDRITEPGIAELTTPSGANSKEFNYLTLKFTLVTTDPTQSPVMEGYTLKFIMRPECRWGFNFWVLAETDEQWSGTSNPNRTAKEIRKELLAFRNSKAPVIFTDLLGEDHIGYITAVMGQPTQVNPGDENNPPEVGMRWQVNFVELFDLQAVRDNTTVRIV